MECTVGRFFGNITGLFCQPSLCSFPVQTLLHGLTEPTSFISLFAPRRLATAPIRPRGRQPGSLVANGSAVVHRSGGGEVKARNGVKVQYWGRLEHLHGETPAEFRDGGALLLGFGEGGDFLAQWQITSNDMEWTEFGELTHADLKALGQRRFAFGGLEWVVHDDVELDPFEWFGLRNSNFIPLLDFTALAVETCEHWWPAGSSTRPPNPHPLRRRAEPPTGVTSSSATTTPTPSRPSPKAPPPPRSRSEGRFNARRGKWRSFW